MCMTKWTEHGSVKRKGRERSLSHSFSTHPLASSFILFTRRQRDRGLDPLYRKRRGLHLPLTPPHLPPNIYRQPVNMVGMDKWR